MAILEASTDVSMNGSDPLIPYKRSLPALETVLDAGTMRWTLRRIVEVRRQEVVQIDQLRMTVLQCRSKRCVIRYRIVLGDGTLINYIGKVYRKNQGRPVLGYMQALWQRGFDRYAEDHVSIPEPVAFIPELSLLLQEEIPGRPAKELIRQNGDPSVMRQLARGLAKLHSCGYQPDVPFRMENHLMRCHPKYQVLSMAMPELEDQLEYVVQSAMEMDENLSTEEFATIHGDFHLSQVHISGDQSWLLDFDPLSYGDPAADLANMIVLLKGKSRKWGNVPLLIDTFLDEYFSLMDDKIAKRIPLYEAMTYLRRACKKLRFQRPGWREEIQNMIPKSVACIEQVQAAF